VFKRGDWVELRDAPNTRGILLYVFNTDATILLSGDRDLSSISVQVLEDQWEPMQFSGEPPPFWCHKKAVFRTKLTVFDAAASTRDPQIRMAEVEDVRPGWVSYYARFKTSPAALGDPQFFMTRWWEFRHIYEPVQPPSAWDHLMNADD
jgi:hypothetical protein